MTKPRWRMFNCREKDLERNWNGTGKEELKRVWEESKINYKGTGKKSENDITGMMT